MNLNP